MTDQFYHANDWESSSGPIISRQFAEADIWPVGLNSESDGTGDKEVLADGDHPCVAIGPKASRAATTPVGVILSWENVNLLNLNVASGFCFKAYVANVLTYSQGSPATFDQSLAIGEPVYVDDSDSLAAGITLSRSPANDDAGANPLAGWLFYDQDDYLDAGVGGANTVADWPKVVANSLVYTLVTVMLK